MQGQDMVNLNVTKTKLPVTLCEIEVTHLTRDRKAGARDGFNLPHS
jgi:hypothetical protein